MSRPSGLRRFTAPPAAAPAAPAPAGPAPAAPAAEGSALPMPAAGPTPDGQDEAEERCEFCATGIPATHGHVADLEKSSLVCACRACYLLFTQGDDPPEPPGSPGSGRTPPRGASPRGSARYRSVPDRYLRDSSRPLSVTEWDELQIPVGLAFFLYSSERGTVGGFYPSPAGATECTLDLDAWDRLATSHPLLGAAQPDVEAVLLCREGPAAEPEYFIVPIDVCYELAGRMRMLWKGFDGGSEARASIDEFLAGVRKHARDASPGGRPPGAPRESAARGDPPAAGPTSPTSGEGSGNG